ncbi:putative HTH-type transcriptional regulator [Candidatus Bilamarchaeum dharawalense]|uniref:Putative HTH-type transcriptional regulator n=1 Tax=Candidatus Bilamarchaeum dharawalense TaxID=2885759 RepID=A0A5E4LM64_9ARCH|nr:putative HTH-type transcriptional regulator [Candidatus Bilamarchaeum dharawalense]
MPELDEVNRKILAAIKDDARFSTNKIAEKIGISPATFKRRLRKLINEGSIKKFATVINYEICEKPLTAYVFVSCEGGGENVIRVLGEVSKHVLVEEATPVLGRFDIIIKVHVRDNTELGEFVQDFVRKLPKIERTETWITASTLEKAAEKK